MSAVEQRARWISDLREHVAHCVEAADEGVDYAVSREMLEAMTTLGLMEKVGRGKWAPTDAARLFARAGQTLPIDVRGKFHDVPIPVHLHIIALRDALALQAQAAGAAEDQVQTLRIPAQPGLDPITVHIDNWGIGRGRATIACYGDAWTCCWNAMGNRTLLQFLTKVDPDYVAGNMLSFRKHTKADRTYAVKIAAAVIEAAKLAAAPAPEGGSHG